MPDSETDYQTDNPYKPPAFESPTRRAESVQGVSLEELLLAIALIPSSAVCFAGIATESFVIIAIGIAPVAAIIARIVVLVVRFKRQVRRGRFEPNNVQHGSGH